MAVLTRRSACAALGLTLAVATARAESSYPAPMPDARLSRERPVAHDPLALPIRSDLIRGLDQGHHR